MELVQRTSSLVDRGRSFFYLEATSTHPGGLQAPIINLVLLSFELCRSLSELDSEKNEQLGWAFWRVRRAFLSATQRATRISAAETPSTPKEYVAYLLNELEIGDLPTPVRDLAFRQHTGFQDHLKWNNEPLGHADQRGSVYREI
jgi:hypothetical protein